MKKALEVSKDLSLPLDAVTQKIAVLGMSGSGKSYCMTKLAEEMLDARAQVVILDPKGEAWGLRLKADGKTPAYSIPVLGGDHADAPLRPDMGARVAELIVKSDYSMVLDVSEWITQEWAQFGFEFATRLLQLKKRSKSAMCLMIDEAQDFIPQNPGDKGWVPKMLGAFERLQKQGRATGVGFVMSSQRPQDVNKKALNLSELWITFQLAGTQERDATVKTIGEKDKEAARAIDAMLPTLEIGHGYFWSPRWLKVSQVHHVLKKKTFDSSATPEVGARRVEPRELSPVDIESLTTAMQDVIERAKADDPKELRKKIRTLETANAQLQKRVDSHKCEGKTEQVEVPVVPNHLIENLHVLVHSLVEPLERVTKTMDQIREDVKKVAQHKATPAQVATRERERQAAPRVREPKRSNDDLGITRPQQKILDALAWLEQAGINHPTRGNVAAVAGASPKSSGFRANVSTLSGMKLLHYPREGHLALTESGRAVASDPSNAMTLADLQKGWLDARFLTGPQKEILRTLIRIYPDSISREDLADAVDVSSASSGYRANVSTLSGFGLVIYPEPGQVRANKELLFPEGLR